jgi:hypothetical protein
MLPDYMNVSLYLLLEVKFWKDRVTQFENSVWQLYWNAMMLEIIILFYHVIKGHQRS